MTHPRDSSKVFYLSLLVCTVACGAQRACAPAPPLEAGAPRSSGGPIDSAAPSGSAKAKAPSEDPPRRAPGAARGAGQASVPELLACLQSVFGGAVVSEHGRWFLDLRGTRIPFDDGRAKSFEESLEAPDLNDMFEASYGWGQALQIETKQDFDPGRVRVEQLFKLTYGASPDAVQGQLVAVGFVGHRVMIHRAAAPALERVAAKLADELRRDQGLQSYLSELGGTFNWRPIAGTDRLSGHSFGIAIDLNPNRADYWRWRANERAWRHPWPRAIVDAFEREGFIWGGRWYHYDTMHFEYRPELQRCTARSPR